MEHHRPSRTSLRATQKTNPNSRRIIVSAWNVGGILTKMAFNALSCAFFQFHVADVHYANCISEALRFPGVPFKVSSAVDAQDKAKYAG